MQEMKYCQSCGMPLDSEEVLGTNKDKSKNVEYCSYCFKDGAFLTDYTMEEMIDVSVKHMSESGMLKEQGKTKEEAREFMQGFFPELKRWKNG
ncbi:MULTISPECIES: zinc ribbon domain-containing protein [Enterococcus]|uniref:Putative zinc ribbon domain-containing protein n=1 Tax=Candidatus Enterococcus mangumiae TaxID=2230878 RepID=A0ABZ2SXS1_9ENTE|nr:MULTISPECIES: zinc ribbon domain-containing protein [unclassified Enterococcus]MBO0461015.1 zinc ribbon domain-containing protein [Enterococcus sp. DIV1298c]MBO0490819.1 zinc ribbon domain-containing protein [Enterococcus sp. DIV1094]MBO1300697.1 zinc ribbon domain-containing protein [Enterococcus sp. DIV1271a]